MTWRDPPTQRLLEAMRAVGSDLELQVVLEHLVEAAVVLVQAESGALGLVGPAPDDAVTEFITVGLDDDSGQAGPGGRDTPADLVGGTPVSPPRSAGHAGGGSARSVLDVPVRVGGTVFGTLHVTDRRDGRPFTDDDEEVLSALAATAGVAIRHARMYDQSRRETSWREAGRDVSTSLLSGDARHAVIGLLVDTTLRVLRADSVFLGLTEGSELLAAATTGAPAPSQDAGLLARLRAVLVTGTPQPAESAGLVGFAVPLGPVGSPCTGLLTALWSTPPHPLLVQDLQEFAAQAAVALELADRRDAAEHGAMIADRDRIGRDLHDLVIQRLFATGMRLQSAVRLVPTDPGEAVRRVDLAVDDLDATIKELRSTIHGLQAPLDGRPSLRARLLEAVDAGTVHLGFAPAVRLDGLLDTMVPPALAEHALATLREALSNVARHAGAQHVEVSVGLRQDSLHVVVEDDGAGLAGTTGGNGLRNLRSRADELGGGLRLDVGTLGGTRLTWSVPVAS